MAKVSRQGALAGWRAAASALFPEPWPAAPQDYPS